MEPIGKACLGVDVQGPRAVFVRADRSRGQARCVALSAEAAAEAARAGLPVAGCLTSRESFTRWLEAPFPGFARAARVLPTLLDIQLPFPLEDCVYAVAAMRKAGRTAVRALAVAARAETVRKTLAAFSTRGLDPVRLDQESLALWTQSLEEAPPARQAQAAWRAVVYIGDDRCTVVLGQGCDFVDAHGAPAGDAGQIGRILRSHLPPGTNVCWFWAGPGAADAGRLAAVRERLTAEWPGVSAVASAPESFLARAVATRALTGGPLRVNLRTGALAHPADAREMLRRQAAAAWALILSGALLAAVSLAANARLARQETRLELARQALAGRLAGHGIGEAKGEQALRIVANAVAAREEALRPFAAAFQPSLCDRLQAILVLGRQQGLTYDALSLSGDQVAVRGTAPDWKSCENLLGYLQTAGYAARVERKEPALQEERVSFTISAGGTP
jgi:hypothetical protein